jgi:hypothetical protein
MKFACTRCGSRNWPAPDSSCPLCNDGREEPGEALGDPLEAREQALERFTREGCWFTSSIRWWVWINKQTDEDLHPAVMAERLAWLHTEACRDAWEDMEQSPSHYAWADVCALAGFDLCKHYRKTNQ